jgi:hypothetical protein
MTTTDLTALCRAWLGGDATAGPPLHDALCEAGWPLEWRRPQGIWQLWVAGFFCAAELWRRTRPHKGWAFWPIRGREESYHRTARAAKTAAEQALRRALRGEGG